jgi:hypothetical protein
VFRHISLLSLPLLLAAPLTGPAAAVVWHLPGDFPTIQEALDTAESGDAVALEPGTYHESRLRFHGKALLLISTHPSDSTVVESTVIDGDGEGPVVIFDGEEGPGSIIQGVTVRGGLDGGVVFDSGAAATLRRCLITANEGAGLQIINSSPSIESCKISANHGAVTAGGVHISGGASPQLRGCDIVDNSSDFVGGGLVAEEGAGPFLQHCTLRDNSAADYGGAIWIADTYVGPAPEGGDLPGIDHAPPTFYDCLISGNEVYGRGGGSVALRSGGDLRMDRCRILDNVGLPGGAGFYINASTAELTRCEIRGNDASTGAGLFIEEEADVWLAGCTIAENSADLGGGVRILDGASALLDNCFVVDNSAAFGAGIYIATAGVDLNYCTFTGNIATEAGGALELGGEGDWAAANSCIFWANAPAEFGGTTEGVSAYYCDITGGWSGAGNIDADPNFFTYDIFQHSYPYFLSAGSPCIDHGDPEEWDAIYDVENHWPAELPNDHVADMGGYGGPLNFYWMPISWP